MILEGKFRDDLYYRLCVSPIEIRPLRERGEDIVLLANNFLNEIDNQKTYHKDTLDCFVNYPWPGNVRELRNAIMAMVNFAEDVLMPEHIPI